MDTRNSRLKYTLAIRVDEHTTQFENAFQFQITCFVVAQRLVTSWSQELLLILRLFHWQMASFMRSGTVDKPSTGKSSRFIQFIKLTTHSGYRGASMTALINYSKMGNQITGAVVITLGCNRRKHNASL